MQPTGVIAQVKKHHLLGWLKFIIAGLGLWWVLTHTPWHDQVQIASGVQVDKITFVEPFAVGLLDDQGTTVQVSLPEKPARLRLADGQLVNMRPQAAGLPRTLSLTKQQLVELEGEKTPAIQVGLINLVKHANAWLLLLAGLIQGFPFFITAWRWKKLMEPQGLFLSYRRCLTLTFVGQFYSTFLPGVTGGDLLKIIYAARVTGSRTKSTVTVLLDRVIGLVGLILVAGIAAAFGAAGNPTMLRVLLLVLAILGGLALLTLVYFSNRLRRVTGLAWLLDRPQVPEFVRHADETLRVYKGHVGLLAVTLLITVVSQLSLPLTGWLAGMSFQIQQANLGHYMAYLPVAILAASLPISPPQGFGVIESILFHFFHNKGLASAGQAFALAQAIRFLPMAWNLLGSWWVIRGDYSSPSMTEKAQEAES